jgi:hypothetical protein
MRRHGVAGKIHASGQRYAALTALQDTTTLKGPLFGLVSSARRGKRSARQTMLQHPCHVAWYNGSLAMQRVQSHYQLRKSTTANHLVFGHTKCLC